MVYIFVFIFFWILLLLYFKLAGRFGIIDKPNNRSSHSKPTVRGGGIVFVAGILLWFATNQFAYPLFFAGFLLIAVVSFVDDVRAQPAWIRFSVHLVAFLLLAAQVQLLDQAAWILITCLIVGLGTLNAFNFMDGINGITGLYALVNLICFYIINKNLTPFTNQNLLLYMMMSVLVFLFFNFRKKARCFAGDIGSITLAFVQIFLLLQLIHATGNYGWVLLFLVYGVDAVVTIVYRLRKRENIFEAHRSHLYQYLSNELKVSHLLVSTVYAIIQVVINILLMVFLMDSFSWLPLVILAVIGVVYVLIREVVLKKIGIKGLFTT